jgi:hypothetical protein
MHLVRRTTAPFRCSVGGTQAGTVDSQHGCDVDDGSPTVFSHKRQNSTGEQPNAAHVYVERLVPLVGRDLLDSAGMQHAGVVEENVDGTKLTRHLRDQAIDIGRVRNIERDDQRVGTALHRDRFEDVPTAGR